MPTLLDVGGANIPDSLDGKSLLNLMRTGEDSPREYLHGEHSFGPASNHYIVTPRDKYLWYSQSGKEQYFDLKADPLELHNRISDESSKDRIEYLRSLLIDELKDREEGYSDGEKLIVGRQVKSSLSKIKPE